MIETIYALLEEKEMLESALPVPYKDREYLMQVEYLIDNLKELPDERIQLHAKRIMNADRKNNKRFLVLSLQAAGRDIVRISA